MDNQPPETSKEEVPAVGPTQPTPSPQPIQPQTPPQTQPQPSANAAGPLMPGQVIGSNSAASQPAPPAETPASPLPQPVVGSFSPETSPNNRKKWVLIVVGIVLLVLIIIAAIFFLNSTNKNDNSASKNTQNNSNASSSGDISSWQTYSDKLIALKYPSGWKVESDDPMYGPGSFHITPSDPKTSGEFLGLSEDDRTDNAKSNNSKAYWREAYAPFGKVLTENSDSINGYDTYSVKQEPATPASFDLYTVVGKSGVKIVFNYGSWQKNKDTYEKIVSTIKLN